MKKYLAELIGTAALCLIGCGAIVIGAYPGDYPMGILPIGLAFGLAIMGMTAVIGPISGCHINPAVTLGACAIAHGTLSITISSTPVISQPNAFSGGQTVVTEKATIDINQAPGKLIQIPAATQLSDVVRALNSLGATPQDLLAILQAIKSAGALNAELEVI